MILTQEQKEYIDKLQTMNRQERRKYEKSFKMKHGTIETTNVPKTNQKTA